MDDTRHRTKNDREDEVPLSRAALTVLRGLPRWEGSGGRVFSTTGTTAVSGFSRAKRRIDAAMSRETPNVVDNAAEFMAQACGRGWRIHDLRRTAATGMARLGSNLPVIERVLNHTSGSFSGVV